MWKSYSEAGDLAARITVERERLLEGLKAAVEKSDSVFLDDVTYLSEAEVTDKWMTFARQFAVSLLKRPVGERMWFEGMRQLMQFKRVAFEDECEARLMLVAWEQLVSKNWLPEDVPKTFDYHFPFNDLIEEIMLHPSVETQAAEALATQLRQGGYNGLLSQSGLYAPRKFDAIL